MCKLAVVCVHVCVCAHVYVCAISSGLCVHHEHQAYHTVYNDSFSTRTMQQECIYMPSVLF